MSEARGQEHVTAGVHGVASDAALSWIICGADETEERVVELVYSWDIEVVAHCGVVGPFAVWVIRYFYGRWEVSIIQQLQAVDGPRYTLTGITIVAYPYLA